MVCWLSLPSFRVDGRLTGSGQKRSAKPVAHNSTAPPTASNGPLTPQGCINSCQEKYHKIQGGQCARWARAAGVKFTRRQANLGAHAPWLGLCHILEWKAQE
eukprot:1137740-Pelagomonas_calceolata.AAC.4